MKETNSNFSQDKYTAHIHCACWQLWVIACAAVHTGFICTCSTRTSGKKERRKQKHGLPTWTSFPYNVNTQPLAFPFVYPASKWSFLRRFNQRVFPRLFFQGGRTQSSEICACWSLYTGSRQILFHFSDWKLWMMQDFANKKKTSL